MKKGFLLLLLASVFSIIISGCQIGGIGKTDSIPDTSSAFKGSKGLELSFFDRAPPEKTVPGATIPIAILLENKGAADITCNDNEREDFGCGYFLVHATEPITVQAQSGMLKSALEKTGTAEIVGKESYLSGGRAAIELTASITDAKQKTSRTITAYACYPYKTFVSAPVCIHTAHYTVSEERLACRIKLISLSDQGAPVAVKKIEQESLSAGDKVKPRFKIFISKVGKGFVFDSSAAALEKACTSVEGAPEIGKVTVEEATLSGRTLTCDKQIILTGSQSKDFIECVEETGFYSGASNNQVSTLKLVLSYGFQTAVSKEVEIDVKEKAGETTDKETIPAETENEASQEAAQTLPQPPQPPFN